MPDSPILQYAESVDPSMGVAYCTPQRFLDALTEVVIPGIPAGIVDPGHVAAFYDGWFLQVLHPQAAPQAWASFAGPSPAEEG